MLYAASDFERVQPIDGEADGDALAVRHPFRRDFGRLVHSPAFRRLQGKTQLFPGPESDFFRNRLTHSLEVAQIAKAIALRINAIDLRDVAPDARLFGHLQTDIVEFAALAHDLGHPPFGHTGEQALDDCMRNHGGFEGNAQTLRILTRLEKKGGAPEDFFDKKSAKDNRTGLNLTLRSLAAILKYDREIPIEAERRDDPKKVCKGYYASEAALVALVKARIAGADKVAKFKTIECQIMDLADDIAYSTYDFDDALKAGFVTPLQVLVDLQQDTELADRIREKVSETVEKEIPGSAPVDGEEMFACVTELLIEHQDKDFKDAVTAIIAVKGQGDDDATRIALSEQLLQFALRQVATSAGVALDGYLRSTLTSRFVDAFISGVKFEPNADALAFSRVSMSREVLIQMEALKHYTYEKQILSPRMRVVEYRGKQIVTDIFKALDTDADKLMPEDCRAMLARAPSEFERQRIICDFIAGMTDRYAVEFYSRLTSETPTSIFKPF